MELQYKMSALQDYKAEQTEDGFYISGYANTKGEPDAYGDIPTSMNGEPVYDLSRFSKNPVALVDHQNSVGSIFGVYTQFEENDRGLKIKLRLMDNPKTEIARHAVEAYKSGFARAFSIGGQWKFENDENPNHLTTAYIHEISGVAIGADESALASTPALKSIGQGSKAGKLEVLEFLIAEYRECKSQDILNIIERLKGI